MILHRLGTIVSESMLNEWNMKYASVPFAKKIHSDVYRIFFSSRDSNNQSYGTYVDYDFKSFKLVNPPPAKPIISKGKLGHFDDSGVTMSCYIDKLKSIYYMGWYLPLKVPFSNQIGKLEFNSNNKLSRSRITPILGKCELEPLSFGYPWVLKNDDSYQMWYDTTLKWKSNSLKDYKFILRSAVSSDGEKWNKTYQQNFPLLENELSIARPCVIKEDGIYKMWCSINKSGKYKLCYAESQNGYNWNRKDKLIKWKGRKGSWESEEQSYPFLIQCRSKEFILYNGNAYGKSGFGICLVDK